MEAKLISLEDFVRSGEGANGESFYHKTNNSVLLKLLLPHAPADSIINELEFARKAYEAGVPTPKPGEFVTDGNGRYGILFERLVGKKSYCRATCDDYANVSKYGIEFGQFCRELHDIHLPKGYFVDVKDKYRDFLTANKFFTPEEKERVLAFINNVPDSDIINHGDLQYGNAIRVEEPDGTVRKMFIDLGDLAIGHPYFDLGQVLLCCKYTGDDFLFNVYHLHHDQAVEFWNWFVKGYWGMDADPDYWEGVIRPYAGLKVLLIQHYFPESPYPFFKDILLSSIN